MKIKQSLDINCECDATACIEKTKNFLKGVMAEVLELPEENLEPELTCASSTRVRRRHLAEKKYDVVYAIEAEPAYVNRAETMIKSEPAALKAKMIRTIARKVESSTDPATKSFAKSLEQSVEKSEPLDAKDITVSQPTPTCKEYYKLDKSETKCVPKISPRSEAAAYTALMALFTVLAYFVILN
jgi:hypothetical protein